MFGYGVLYVCKKCGYKEGRLIGDAIKMEDFQPKKCPKCGETMKRGNFIDQIIYRSFFKRLRK